MVFAIGGFNSKEKIFLKTAEVFSIDNQKWYSLNDMKIERSKPTISIYQDNMFVIGGLTANADYLDNMAETFNFTTEEWETFPYGGFDNPPITNSSSSSSLPIFKDKSTLFFFGGSDAQNLTQLIQPVEMDLEKKQFNLNYIIHELRSARRSPTLGMIKEDTLLCFGGVEESRNFLDIEGFTLKVN